MQVARSADAVVGVAGAAPPVLPCWDSSGPAHERMAKATYPTERLCRVVL